MFRIGWYREKIRTRNQLGPFMSFKKGNSTWTETYYASQSLHCAENAWDTKWKCYVLHVYKVLKYYCTATILFIPFIVNTSVIKKKILCSVKEQFILILELPYKMVQPSEYLIMARKNTGRYFNIFFSLSWWTKLQSFVFLRYLCHETLASDIFPVGAVLSGMS